MKRAISILICTLALCAAAMIAIPTAVRAEQSDTDALVATRIAPEHYIPIGTVTDLASDGTDLILIDELGTHVLTRNEDGTFDRTTVGGTHLRAEIRSGLVATLDADGTLTLHADVPVTETFDGAIDLAMTEDRIVVLDATSVHFIPYARTDDSVDLSQRITVAHHIATPLALYSDATVTAILQQKTGARTISVSEGDSEASYVFENALHPYPSVIHGMARIGDSLCYMVDDGLNVIDVARTHYDFVTDNQVAISQGRLSTRPQAICSYGTGVAIADAANGTGYLQLFDEDFNFVRTAASSSDLDATHFASPSSAYARGNTLIVADTGNKRVLTYGADAIDVTSPIEVAVDAQNVTYVLTASHLLAYRNETQTLALPFVGTDLALLGDNTLLASGTQDGVSGLYAVSGQTLTLLTQGTYTRIASSHKSQDVYALSETGLVRIPSNDPTSVQSVGEANGAIDLAVDDNGVIYLLSLQGVTVFNGTSYVAHTLGGDWDPRFDAHTCFLSATDDVAGLQYGDLVIVSRNGNAIYALQGLGYVDDYSTLVWPEDYTAAQNANVSLACVLTDTVLTSAPDLNFPLETLTAGTVVFAVNTPSPSQFYTQVIVELDHALTFAYNGSSVTSKLVTGFVLTKHLDRLDDVHYDYNSVVRTQNVTVRKYPSDLAVALSEPDMGTVVTMHPTPDYRDCANKKWLKVSVNGVTGYVWEGNLRREFYSDTVSSGDPNATIRTTSLLGRVNAYYYDGMSDTYQPMMATNDVPVTIPNGARVRVVGTFRARNEYTEIVYVDATYGELRCFVATDCIESDNLGVIEAVAIALFLMTVVIGLVVFLSRKRNKL